MGKRKYLDALHQKDEIIGKQSRRISLLEEKFNALRKKFFRMKYRKIFEESHERT